ncbi:MAG TPA: hypothetical protein VK190_10180 [Pseudoneobacillus sp.]|nr:hypothetical protein [Pseudoneobacillus sp.]
MKMKSEQEILAHFNAVEACLSALNKINHYLRFSPERIQKRLAFCDQEFETLDYHKEYLPKSELLKEDMAVVDRYLGNMKAPFKTVLLSLNDDDAVSLAYATSRLEDYLHALKATEIHKLYK